MSKFNQWLRTELESIKSANVISSTTEVRKDEIVLGTLEDADNKKLYALLSVLSQRSLDLVREAAHKLIDHPEPEPGEAHNPATCLSCIYRRRVESVKDDYAAVSSLFWSNVRHDLSETTRIKLDEAGGALGLRKGWQIVGYRPQPEVSLGSLAALAALGSIL